MSDKISILIEKLQNILIVEKINHKDNILKENTLKSAHIYCKINNLNGPFSGILIEYYIENKFNVIKNKSSMRMGDFKYNNMNYEIKTSLGGKYNNKFNFVQIRLNQICNYIFFAYYINKENINNLGELFIFKFSSENIKQLIYKYGAYAHGTILKNGKITIESLNENANEKEYCIRPIYNKKCWNEMLKFRVYEIFN
jgi:hypothetical protein